MDETVCILCGEGDGGKSLQLLGTKGAATINTLAKTYQRPDIVATVGDHVHPHCRKAFGRHPNYKQRPETKNKSPAKHRSLSPGYDSRRDCFYCSQPIKEWEDNRGLISKASTISIVDGVKRAIIDRGNDRWAVELQGRLDHVQCLLAKDCRYHRDCDANFRTSCAISEKHRSTPNAKKTKVGRPKENEREQAFELAVKYLEESENETITISDLRSMMELELEFCGSKHPTFKTKHTKRRLLEKFGKERIIFTSVEGRANLIVFKETADRILQEVHDASEKSPADKVTDVIKAAARLIKEEILSFTDEKKNYPSPEEIGNADEQLAYITSGLQSFLTTLIGEKKLVVAAIGQAIMQNARPRAVLAPLQVALGVQVHHVTGSKFMVQQLNMLGFAVSYSEVQLFEILLQ